jgi:hypothetical protein
MTHRALPKRLTGAAVLAATVMAFVSVAAAQNYGNRAEQIFGMSPNTTAPTLKSVDSLKLDAAAQREPQILGIVASHGPVPFNCKDGSCRVYLSTFCLQQARDNPRPGQSYVPLEGASIILTGKDSLGRVVRLAAAPYVNFTADRGFTAIEVTLPPAKLAELGLHDLALEVGDKVSLLPAATAEDSATETMEDGTIAIGKLRARAAAFFDQSTESGDAIRLANLMINVLPVRGSFSDSDGRVLEVAIASEAGQASGIKGVTLVREMYAICWEKVDVAHYFDSMRSCLEATHDQLVTHTNIDFWNSLVSY